MSATLTQDTRRRLVLALIWVALFAGICTLQWWQAQTQQRQQQQLLTETVQRQLLEKVAQHSAHLTALAALAPLPKVEGQPFALTQVAQSIQTFYPRIEHIALLSPGDKSADSCSQPPAELATRPLRPGESSSLPDTQSAGRYLLVKKVAPPGGWLCMRINAERLLEPLVLPKHTGIRLLLQGQSLLEPALGSTQTQAQPFGQFALQGYGQPLEVELFADAQPWAVLSWLHLLGYGSVSLALVLLLGQAWKSRQQARRHQQRAQLLANEAQLAHASRVNGMGEMASGIAHELAQPVTALLSQSQAALRALEMGKPELLHQALHANVRQARRAGDILGRIRSYISNAPSQPQLIDLGQLVTQALLLLQGPATQARVELVWQAPEKELNVWADPVALEQVLHNLVRNALDALAESAEKPLTTAQIELTLQRQEHQALISVQDNGPGISPAALEKIFDPFFTTKPGGMGLGLPLCATLMERMGGSLDYVASAAGACFVLRLPLSSPSNPTGPATGAAPNSVNTPA